MGHTIQDAGVNAACGGRALRVDVGMSRGCGDGKQSAQNKGVSMASPSSPSQTCSQWAEWVACRTLSGSDASRWCICACHAGDVEALEIQGQGQQVSHQVLGRIGRRSMQHHRPVQGARVHRVVTVCTMCPADASQAVTRGAAA
jgi:hypothetical protein